MYARYINEYKQHSVKYGPNTAIFMLVGSFYELYDIPDADGEYQTSMKRATDILGIANVEKRGDAPGGKNGRFAGFGEPQLHKYAAMLTRELWTVVIIDQVKDATGKVRSRDVARILSPGTHVEISQSDPFYLAGLWLDAGDWSKESEAPSFGSVAIDLTTGEIHTYEGATTGRRTDWSSDSLLHFFQVYQPKELIVWWRGHAIDKPAEEELRRTLGIPQARIHIYMANPEEQGGLEKPIVREDLFRRSFKPKSLLEITVAIGIKGYPIMERALAALLLFTQEHHESAINMLRIPLIWTPMDSVYLGNHALTQLNMITAREEDSVLALFLKGYTQMGRRAMRRRLLYPITLPNKLERQYTEIDWCMSVETGVKEACLSSLRQIADLSRLHRKLTVAGIQAGDVLALDQSYHCAMRIAEYLRDSPLSVDITPMKEYMDAFRGTFDIDKARKSSEDLFCLKALVAPQCAAIEDAIMTARQSIQDIHGELAAWVGVERGCFRLEEKDASIVIGANRAVILQATTAIKGSAPIPQNLRAIQVHAKKSSSSLEVPAINALYTKILQLRDKLVAAIRTELPPVCDMLTTKYLAVWDKMEGWISQVDMAFTIARVSKERGFVRPEILSDEGGTQIRLTGLRHPLIEGRQTRVEYVKHDVRLGLEDEQGWLVYGMNASGKSSLMKAVGIATILAQCGAFVPATKFQYVPVRALFTRILNTDNLWAGLSSFAVEMTELADILKKADAWSLVLGDEVCSGTESLSAISLVGASLEHLYKRGARFIFATHLHGLQKVSSIAALGALKVWHLRVRHDRATQRLLYDRTLHPGAGSSLYGLEVAKAMAIPLEVLEAAHQIRRSLTGEETEQTAKGSEWNTAIQCLKCEVCSAGIASQLEVHHIKPRASAVDGRLPDGTAMNDLRNLVVVCQKCHDANHAGQIEIGGVKQTSEGEVREVVDLKKYVYKPPAITGFTSEEIEVVKAELRAYPNLPVKRMIFDLENLHGIKITAHKLSVIRQNI